MLAASVGLAAEKLNGLPIRPGPTPPSGFPNFTPRSLATPCTPVPTVLATVATPLRLLSRNWRVRPSPFGAQADSHVIPLSAAANRVSLSLSKELTDVVDPDRLRLASGRRGRGRCVEDEGGVDDVDPLRPVDREIDPNARLGGSYEPVGIGGGLDVIIADPHASYGGVERNTEVDQIAGGCCIEVAHHL